MDKDIPYIKVGLFVVISVCMMIALGLFLAFKNMNTSSQTTYVILTDETISGLTIGSPVKYHGLQVGSVSSVNIAQKATDANRSDALIVYVKIDNSAPINSSSVAIFEPAGITGQLFVNITTVDLNAKPIDEKFENLVVIPNSPGTLKKYAQQLNELFKNMNKIGTQVEKVLSDQNVENVSKTIAGVQELIVKMNAQADTISPALTKVGDAMQQGEKTLLDISQTAKSITAITDNVNSQLNAGVFNIRPDIEKLKNDVTKTSKDADILIKRIDSMLLKFEIAPVDFMINGAAVQPGPGE